MTGLAPTNMTPDWIARVIAANPWTPTTAGCLRTPPLRIGFPHVDKAQKSDNDEGESKEKYSVAALLQPGSDDVPLRQLCAQLGQEKWGDLFASYAQSSTFHKPFKDQGEKSQYEGFVPGLPYFSANGERKPAFVTQNMSPYVGRIYPGLWAFLEVRPFTFERRNKQGSVVKRGIGVGLQSLMFIADDVEWGGGGSDPTQAFAGVKIDANVNPSAAFGAVAQAEPTAADIFR